jgi:site-specific DNA-methyltransferase (adenine-specific)
MTTTIIHSDCLDAMRSLPDASVDAVVTDPPYLNTGTGASRVSKTQGVPDERQFFDLWMREVWREWARILKPTGAVWLTIDWRGAVSCERASFGTNLKFGGIGVWDRGGLGMGYMLRHTYECFAVGRMPEWKRAVTDEPDVWRHEWFPGSRKHGHEAEKPVELFRRAIRLLAPPSGGVVLDPFAGSGTLGVAAAEEGVSSILVERESDFVALIERRCA